MPRLKSVRGPKRLSKNVTIAQEYHRQNVHKLLITIKLPSDQLKGVNENQNLHIPNISNLLPPQSAMEPNASSSSQQEQETQDLLNIFDFDIGEFEQLESELNQALIQPQSERRKSNDTRGFDIIEALKASPRRRSLGQGRNEKQEAQPTQPPVQSVTPTRRRRPANRPAPLPMQGTANYKPVPANIIPILKSELPGFRDKKEEVADDDDDDDDDDGIEIGSVTFSLKDPLAGNKVKLPVRSRFCFHFECFDFENFCLFYRIPTSIKDITRKTLIQNNFNELTRRKNSTQHMSQPLQNRNVPPTTYQQIMPFQANLGPGPDYSSPMVIQQLKLSPYVKIVDNPLPGHNYTLNFVTPGYEACPFYSCPICSTKFPLSALQISDAFNYFVKTTPPQVDKIELVSPEKYRPIGESESVLPTTNERQVLLLSSDDEDDERERQDSATKQKMKLDNFVNGSSGPFFSSGSNPNQPDPDYHGYSRDDPIVLD